MCFIVSAINNEQCTSSILTMHMYRFRPVTDALEIPHINERFSINNHVALVCLARTFMMQVRNRIINCFCQCFTSLKVMLHWMNFTDIFHVAHKKLMRVYVTRNFCTIFIKKCIWMCMSESTLMMTYGNVIKRFVIMLVSSCMDKRHFPILLQCPQNKSSQSRLAMRS